MTKERKLAESVERQKYFESARTPSPEQDEGTRELGKYIKTCFPNPKVPLKKLLKKEEYLKDSTWVENLCADGKLEQAIERAEKNIAAALKSGTLEQQSYTFVYKVFKG